MKERMESSPRSTTSRTTPSTEQLQAILDLSRKMNAEHDLSALLHLLAKEGARLMSAERATIFLLDRERCELWSQVTLDGESIRLDARLGIAGAAAMSGQTVNVPDAQQDSRFHQAIDARTQFCTRSALAVPLRDPADDVIGVFEALNKAGGPFTEGDEQIAQALSAQAALAVNTAHLLQNLTQERERLQKENVQLRREVEERFSTRSIIGTSHKVQALVRLIDQIRDSSVDVLITGESGTGKEMIAKAIHYNSPRAQRPFVALNCAALPENLMESELLGIEKGVATGVERRVGKFEQAHEGTLFLDEIGDLSLTAQAKILRALQERVIERVGGRTPISVDVRIVAATHVNLEDAISQGKFREDLYYRLKVIQIQTPALREIREDIPHLANHFLEKYCREMGKEPKRLTPAALRRFADYAWPGNTRQLENEIKRLVASTRRVVIGEEDLAENIRSSSGAPLPPAMPEGGSLKDVVVDLETRLIRDALRQNGNNQVKAAKTLGLSRQGLIKKMKRYRITSAS
jgi:Nif-specific regulatory protein